MLFRNRADLDRYRKTQADLLFEWPVPDLSQLAERKDGSIALVVGGLGTDRSQSQWITTHSAEWVNFTLALRHTMSELPLLISAFGFLSAEGEDSRADWEEILQVLDTALRPWGDYQPRDLQGQALVFGAIESAIPEAEDVLRVELRAAISNGTIVADVKDDMAVSVKPTDLRSFMLLDAAQAFLTKADYVECLHCGNAFRPHDNRQRSYCSIECRSSFNQKKYLKRKAE